MIAQERGAAVDIAAVDEAARLAKTDLTTELVKEFTELQGVIGGLYARAQGLAPVVAEAIYDQYLPASATDSIPRSTEGAMLGLADRMDTLAGLFRLGLDPTGSKDPFALRRAANGILKMLAESSLQLTLREVAEAATEHSAVPVGVLAFLSERLEWYLREVRGGAYDVVKAVMATAPVDVRDAMARVDAVTEARAGADFAAIAAAFKRMKNIVEQAKEKGEAMAWGPVAFGHLREPEDLALMDQASRRAAEVEAMRVRADYVSALHTIARLRPYVDSFFEKVMVMSPDRDLRMYRLGLLKQIVEDFSKIADFSEIVIAG